MKERAPEQRSETIRQEILELLDGRELSIGELSKAVRKSEKELYDHIDSLRKYKGLKIIPAECLKCHYIFENRERSKKPGKCPKCKGSRIDEPLFTYLPQ